MGSPLVIEMMVRRFESDAEGLALWSARHSWSMRMVRAAPDGKGDGSGSGCWSNRRPGCTRSSRAGAGVVRA